MARKLRVFVETVPRRGYRFIHSVELQPEVPQSAVGSTAQPAEEAVYRRISGGEHGIVCDGRIVHLHSDFRCVIVEMSRATFLLGGCPRYVSSPLNDELRRSPLAPDGRTIVYNSSVGGTSGELLLLSLDGLGPHRSD